MQTITKTFSVTYDHKFIVDLIKDTLPEDVKNDPCLQIVLKCEGYNNVYAEVLSQTKFATENDIYGILKELSLCLQLNLDFPIEEDLLKAFNEIVNGFHHKTSYENESFCKLCGVIKKNNKCTNSFCCSNNQ